MEQFSLKTNWKLTERLLYSQGCEKDPHESNQIRTCALGRGLRGKGRIHRHRPALGSEWWKPKISSLSLGVLHREDEPPWLVGGLREAWAPLVRSTLALA